MADRITQLQQAIHLLADHFYNSIGLLQQVAESVSQSNSINARDKIEVSHLPNRYSRFVSRTSYDIYTIIDSLPTSELSQQNNRSRLDLAIKTNHVSAEELKGIIISAKFSLLNIRHAQTIISDLQLKMLKEI